MADKALREVAAVLDARLAQKAIDAAHNAAWATYGAHMMARTLDTLEEAA